MTTNVSDKMVSDKQKLTSQLQPTGQEHLLAFWDELDADQQASLGSQIEALDLAQIESLYRGNVDQPDWAELSRQATPPAGRAVVRTSERRGW